LIGEEEITINSLIIWFMTETGVVITFRLGIIEFMAVIIT